MARIKIERIADHLSTEITSALEETIKEHFPNQTYNAKDVFRTFKGALYNQCTIWQKVPDLYVKKDNALI